jgi:hypothetical protein
MISSYKDIDMNYDEMKGRFTQLNKLIEAADAEKAPEEFVNKLIAERAELRWKIQEAFKQPAPDTFESEYPANWQRRIED